MQSTETRTVQEVAKELAYGRTLTFKLPSGYSVTIREQNGNDDDILTNNVTSKDMTNFNIFLASLIVETDLPFANNGKLTAATAAKILVKDKYYIIIMSRIHSMGNIVRVTFNWGKEDGGKVTYEEDLNRYVWDYDKPFPEEGEPEYDKERIEPYLIPNPYEEQEITLQSGKRLKFNLYNGISETTMLKLPADQISRNSEIKARNLMEFIGGVWVKVENFESFKPKDMSELKKLINLADPPFKAMTDLENPNTKEVVEFPIMGTTDFFYPEEI